MGVDALNSEVFQFIINYRVDTKSTNNEYHSRPQSLKRFCQFEKDCVLKQHYQWCDMCHPEDLQPGDIIITHCYNANNENRTTLVMIQQLGEEIRCLPLHVFKNSRNNFITKYVYPKEREKIFLSQTNNIETYLYTTQQMIKSAVCSRFVASLEELCDFHNIPDFHDFHFFMLAERFSNSESMLNLLLNGQLPREELLKIGTMINCSSNVIDSRAFFGITDNDEDSENPYPLNISEAFDLSDPVSSLSEIMEPFLTRMDNNDADVANFQLC